MAPEDFGAVGDGSSDDAVALQQWASAIVADANAGREPVGVVSKLYATSRSIEFAGVTGAFTIRGQHSNAGFVQRADYVATPSPSILSIIGGSEQGSVKVLAASAAEGVREVTLNNVTDLAIGDAIWIWAMRGFINRGVLARIVRIIGNTVYIDQPILFPIIINYDSNSVRKVALCPNVTVENLIFIGAASVGGGPRFLYLDRPIIKNIYTRDFRMDGGVGLLMMYCLDGIVENYLDERSGISASFNITRSSRMTLKDVRSMNSAGYAMILGISNSRVEDLYSHGATGRGIEFYSASGVTGLNIICNVSGATGLSIVYGCHNNMFSHVTAIQNAHQNIWLNGIESKYQRFFGLTTFWSGVAPDILVSPTDDGAAFYGIDPRATKAGQPDTVFA